MTDPMVSFSAAIFAESFPFGFVLDAAGRPVVVGAVLGRLHAVQPGDDVEADFEVLRPPECGSVAEALRAPNAVVVLRHRASGLEVKGSAVPLSEAGQVAFIGSPILHSVREVAEQRLTLRDFSPSDATPDLLLSMQATTTALEDARKLGESLRVALNDAHAAVRAKERFLAVMSHEIRTPLNGFGAMIDLLRTTQLTPEQEEQLSTMDTCTHALLALVNDILDLSKLEAKGVELDLGPVRLADLVEQAASPFRARAVAKGLDFQVETTLDPSAVFLGDERRIGQVIANLLGNAVKFTVSGRVSLDLRLTDDGLACVTVTDTGIGIPESARDSLFDPFTQADSSVTRAFGGTGLGLAISHELALAMDGTLELVRSGPDGSAFRFTFSAERAPSGAPQHAEEAPPAHGASPDLACVRGARILIVEDNQMNQVIAQRLVESLGATASVSANGLSAVEMVRETEYDLVLMDLMMPVMAGTEATRAIRALDVPWSDLPIVAFTAGAFEHDREDALASGMDGFLEKPVRLPLLRAVLVEHLTGRR